MSTLKQNSVSANLPKPIEQQIAKEAEEKMLSGKKDPGSNLNEGSHIRTAAEAKERQAEYHGNQYQSALSANLPEVHSEPIRTSETMAKVLMPVVFSGSFLNSADT